MKFKTKATALSLTALLTVTGLSGCGEDEPVLTSESTCLEFIDLPPEVQRTAVRELGAAAGWEEATRGDALSRVLVSCGSPDRDPGVTTLASLFEIYKGPEAAAPGAASGSEAQPAGREEYPVGPDGASSRFSVHPVLGPGDVSELPGAASDGTDGAPIGQFAGPNASGEYTAFDESGEVLRLGPVAMTGADIANVSLVREEGGGDYLSLQLTPAGASTWRALTGEAACQPDGELSRRVAFVFDRKIISSPAMAPDVQCGVGLSGDINLFVGNDEAALRETARRIAEG